MVKYQRQAGSITGGSSHIGGSFWDDVGNAFTGASQAVVSAGSEAGKFIGKNKNAFIKGAQAGASLGAVASGNPELVPFIQMAGAAGGSLADRYHKTHQFTPYEWEHIREAAKQTLLNQPSKHWLGMGITAGSLAAPKGAYLDVIACREPRHAARILQKDSAHVHAFAGALTDSIGKAAKFIGARVGSAGRMGIRAKDAIEQKLPHLLHLGKRAHGAAKAANQLYNAIRGDQKKS